MFIAYLDISRVGPRVFVFKKKTAYEVRISDWSSDVCSSDLTGRRHGRVAARPSSLCRALLRGRGVAGGMTKAVWLGVWPCGADGASRTDCTGRDALGAGN